MMRVSKTCSSPAVGARTAWNTGRPAVCAIDPIEHEAVQRTAPAGPACDGYTFSLIISRTSPPRPARTALTE
jgi:hypothetical protein